MRRARKTRIDLINRTPFLRHIINLLLPMPSHRALFHLVLLEHVEHAPIRRVQRADHPRMVRRRCFTDKMQVTVRGRARDQGVEILELSRAEERECAREVGVRVPVKGVDFEELLFELVERYEVGMQERQVL